jgi:hypothetical protein
MAGTASERRDKIENAPAAFAHPTAAAHMTSVNAAPPDGHIVRPEC